MQGDLKVAEPRGFASNLQRKLKQAYKANITSKNVLGIRFTMRLKKISSQLIEKHMERFR